MTVIRESLYFSYAGIPSTTFNILNVNINSGMQEEPFASERIIREVKIKGRERPYFFGIDYPTPLNFPVSFAFENNWDNDSIRKVASWLCNYNTYQPLFFSGNIDRIYYAMVTESPTLVHNCLKQGYINLNFRTNAPYAFSPVFLSDIYDLSLNPTSTTIQFTNNGDLSIYPTIYIQKVGSGDISIYNQSNGNIEFKFTSLASNEEITIDCENDIIDTSLSDTYRYDNFNDNYLNLLPGVNYLNIVGTAIIRFQWRCRFI